MVRSKPNPLWNMTVGDVCGDKRQNGWSDRHLHVIVTSKPHGVFGLEEREAAAIVGGQSSGPETEPAAKLVQKSSIS